MYKEKLKLGKAKNTIKKAFQTHLRNCPLVTFNKKCR